MSVTGTPSSDHALSLGGAPFAMNSDWWPDSAEPTLTRSVKTVATVGSQVQRSRECGMSWNCCGFSLVVIVARPASTMTDAAAGVASWGLAGGRIVKATVVAAPATTGTPGIVVVANPVSVAVIDVRLEGQIEEVRLASVVRCLHRIVRRADRDLHAGQGAGPSHPSR